MKDLPTAFGYPFFVRSVIPGAVLVLALWPLLGPTLLALLRESGASSLLSIGLASMLLAIFLGWLVSLLDYPIYMLYEGRVRWPKWFWKILEARLQRRVTKLQTLAEGEHTDEQLRAESYFSLRMFPLEGPKEFKVLAPTRLGNLLQAYELYPWSRYGMDSIFYWYRLRLLLDKDTREDYDNSSAEADALVYTSLVLGLSGIVYLSVAASLAVAFLVPALSVSALMIEFDPLRWLGIGALLILLSYGSYRASIHLHRTYGELFKSMFDVGRVELKKRLGPIASATTDEEYWKGALYKLQYLVGPPGAGLPPETEEPGTTGEDEP